MKKALVAVTLAICSVVIAIGLTYAWQARKMAKGGESEHYLFIDSPKEWGFHTQRGETMVAYPVGQSDCNTIHERRQIGPVSIMREYEPDACAKAVGKH